MKILLGDEELEIIKDNQVVFVNDEEEIEEDDEEEEEDESTPPSMPLPVLIYKVSLYKNAQSQQAEKTVRVKAVNMTVQALSEVSAVLFLVNEHGQAVYSVPWELVHSIDSGPSPNRIISPVSQREKGEKEYLMIPLYHNFELDTSFILLYSVLWRARWR